jgi:membrane fusion protein, multidrug efflux system
MPAMKPVIGRKSLLGVGGGIVAVAIGAGVFAWSAGATKARITELSPRPARVMEVAFRPQSQTLSLAGTVVPRIEASLGFRVAGKVIGRDVDLGAVLSAGQLIARLDPTDYRLAVENARAALGSADADYARAKADFDRYTNLRGSTAFMAQTLDQRQSTSSIALARVEQARSQLTTAENNLAYTELHADSPGIVTAVQAEVGQVLAQGQTVVRVARTDEIEILVGVPEHRLKAVREAADASYELWSDPSRRFAAHLRELSPSADPVTRTYPARFSVVEKPDFIGLGMTATLAFSRPDRQSLAEVPLGAIFQQGKEPAVWIVDKASGAVMLRPVTVVRWRDDTALISSGVKDGELIATAGVHKLESGQKVKPFLQAAR